MPHVRHKTWENDIMYHIKNTELLVIIQSLNKYVHVRV